MADKVCSECGSSGPFPGQGGPKCRKCHNAYYRQWRKDHPEVAKAYNTAYYWRNRADMRNQQNATNVVKRLQDEAQGLTTRMEIRLEPDLKDWIMQHGGAEFVRSLLRTKRAEMS
jgi:ribosomal protein L40E